MFGRSCRWRGGWWRVLTGFVFLTLVTGVFWPVAIWAAEQSVEWFRNTHQPGWLAWIGVAMGLLALLVAIAKYVFWPLLKAWLKSYETLTNFRGANAP